MAKRVLDPTNLDDKFFKERVSRTQAFLGEAFTIQESAQNKLRQSTIGIAGAGGIGGAIALRLCRLGVGALKIADPDKFDISNINRQLGASYDDIGKNKAAVVGEMAFDLAKDTRIEIYDEGITHKNASEFVAGCDLILDQLDFSVISEKFALHDAFHKSEMAQAILACSVIGWSAHLYKFTRESMHIQEWYNLSDHSNIESLAADSRTERLLKLWAPRFPHFPTFQFVMDWIRKHDALPIFAGAPPLAEGFLAQRVTLVLSGLERPPYCAVLDPIPNMYIYDAALLDGGIYLSDGTLKNSDEIAKLWRSH